MPCNKPGLHQKDSISEFSGARLGFFKSIWKIVPDRGDAVPDRKVSCPWAEVKLLQRLTNFDK